MAVTWRKLAYEDDVILKTLADANSILYAVTDDTPAALALAASTIPARLAAGDVVAATTTEIRTLINVADGATANAKATGAELDTGTDDAKFATAKAIKDSHNVPSVVPSTAGKVLTSDGTDWISSALGAPAAHTLNSHTAADGAVDFNDQEALDIVLPNSATPPATAVVGKIYMDTDLSAYICTVAV